MLVFLLFSSFYGQFPDLELGMLVKWRPWSSLNLPWKRYVLLLSLLAFIHSDRIFPFTRWHQKVANQSINTRSFCVSSALVSPSYYTCWHKCSPWEPFCPCSALLCGDRAVWIVSCFFPVPLFLLFPLILPIVPPTSPAAVTRPRCKINANAGVFPLFFPLQLTHSQGFLLKDADWRGWRSAFN